MAEDRHKEIITLAFNLSLITAHWRLYIGVFWHQYFIV